MLYNLKTNIERSYEPPRDWKYLEVSSFLCNIFLYWLVLDSKEIKCFDVATQEYYDIPL